MLSRRCSAVLPTRQYNQASIYGVGRLNIIGRAKLGALGLPITSVQLDMKPIAIRPVVRWPKDTGMVKLS